MPRRHPKSNARRCWLQPIRNIFFKMQRAGSIGAGLFVAWPSGFSARKRGERRELCDDSACFLDDDVLTLERTKAKQPVHRDITEAVRSASRIRKASWRLCIPAAFTVIFLQRWARFPFACKPFICGRSLADQRGDGFVESPQDAVNISRRNSGNSKSPGLPSEV